MKNTLIKNDRFVAHFDMLGMKYLTKQNPDLAWKKLSALSNAKAKRLTLEIQRLDTKESIKNQISTFTFSDTIIAFSKGSTENDVLSMLILMTELFTYSLHLSIPLRGGIAHGRFCYDYDLNLFSGPALVDAYSLGESAQWLGIVLDNNTAEAVSSLQNGKPFGSKTIVLPWDVPCKDCKIRRMVVNWPASHRNTYTGPIPITAEDFYAPFESLYGPYSSLMPNDAAKYLNTVDFFNACLRNI